MTVANLGVNYKDAGRVKEAIPLLEEAYRSAKKYPQHRFAGAHLLVAYGNAGQLDKAAKLVPELLSDGANDPNTLIAVNGLAVAYWSAEAARQVGSALRGLAQPPANQTFRPRAPGHAAKTVANLGVNYWDAGRLKEALPLLEEAYQAAKKHPSLRGIVTPLLDAYAKAGENAKFANLLREQLTEAQARCCSRTARNWAVSSQVSLPCLNFSCSCRRRTADPRVPGHPREDLSPTSGRRSSTRSRSSGALALGPKLQAASKGTDKESLAQRRGLVSRSRIAAAQGL